MRSIQYKILNKLKSYPIIIIIIISTKGDNYWNLIIELCVINN